MKRNKNLSNILLEAKETHSFVSQNHPHFTTTSKTEKKITNEHLSIMMLKMTSSFQLMKTSKSKLTMSKQRNSLCLFHDSKLIRDKLMKRKRNKLILFENYKFYNGQSSIEKIITNRSRNTKNKSKVEP